MQRDRQHIGIGVIGHLGPITMMDIPIDDSDMLHPTYPPRMLDGEHDVAEDAEAATTIRCGMVAAGPNQRIGVLNPPLQYGFDGGDAASCGEPGDLDLGEFLARIEILRLWRKVAREELSGCSRSTRSWHC
jgi:hypothetical protein